jgi:hypothetical protein
VTVPESVQERVRHMRDQAGSTSLRCAAWLQYCRPMMRVQMTPGCPRRSLHVTERDSAMRNLTTNG